MTIPICVRFFAVCLSVSPAALHAQGASATPPSDYSYRRLALDLFARNANEASERQESAAARQAAAKASPLSATNFDLNKDGKLDDKEFAAWTAELRKAVEKNPPALKRFDTDKDGKLSDAEWSAAVSELFGEK
jgi:hypothetical protein